MKEEKKKIEDFLHLYLGCEIQFETRKPSIGGDWKLAKSTLTIHRLYELENEIIRNVIPILRPLSSMTEEEGKEFCKISDWSTWEEMPFDETFEEWKKSISYPQYDANGFLYLLSKSFDLFSLIEADLAIDSTKLNAEAP